MRFGISLQTQVLDVGLEIEPNPINKKYMSTKRDKLGHFILDEK